MNQLSRAEKLRAALQAEDDKRQPKATGDSASFPFWNIPDGSNATIRFLPDADPDNLFFWANREIIKLKFAGQVGGDYPTDDEVEVQVPCVDMYGDTCPIIAETKPWWKQGPEKEALARLYWKKKSYVFQGFVVNSPFEEANVPANPIRRFMINPSIFKIIKQTLMDPEVEDVCTDYVSGRDFKIIKSKQGEFANYSTSTWAYRTRPLNEAENIAIQQFGLFNLADFRGVRPDSVRPDADGIAMIKAMFHDSLAGKPFDYVAYGKHYRGFSANGGGNNQSANNQSGNTQSGNAHSGSGQSDTARTAASDDAGEPVSNETGEPAAPAPISDLLERIKKKTIA